MPIAPPSVASWQMATFDVRNVVNFTLQLALLSLACLAGTSATAQTPAPALAPPSLAATTESAWQRALASREAAGARLRVEADRRAAASLSPAAPSVELTHRDDRLRADTGQRETELSLVWPLWLPGQRGARGAAAEAGASVAQHAEAMARLRVAGEVREAAWALDGRLAELTQAEATGRLLTTLSGDVDRRVRAGDLARSDALAARADTLAASARTADARQQLFAAQNRWQWLTGSDALPTADEASTGAVDVLDVHPEMRLARAHAEAAQRRLDVLRGSRRDPPEVTVGVRQDRAGRGEASQGSVAVGVRVPFGTDARNAPLEAAALAELDMAQFAAERGRERLLAEADAARGALQAAEQQLAAERDRAALLRERAQLIDKSFRAGESPLPDLLRALAAASDADATLARQQSAQGLARARFRQALGLMP